MLTGGNVIGTARRQTGRTAALTATVLAVLAMVAAAIAGALGQADLVGVTSVLATRDAVWVAVGHELLVLDSQGALRSVAADRAGRPWAFDFVSWLATDASGRVWAQGARIRVPHTLYRRCETLLVVVGLRACLA